MQSPSAQTQAATPQFCSQCGNRFLTATRFCGQCGMSTDPVEAASVSPLQETPSPQEAKTMSVWQAWAWYLGCIAFFAIVIQLSGLFAFNVYFVIGFFMSRFVMRRLVEWHPHYNTLHNVVSAKIWMFLLWPLNMLVLLLKFSLNSVL